MGAQRQQRAGTVRRIVRVAGHFVCGICRHPYDELPAAYHCLDRCWQEFLSLDPVIIRQVSGQIAFRCRICARDYESKEQARHCAGQCKERVRIKAAMEDRLTDSEEHVPKREPLRIIPAVRIVPKVPVPARKMPAPKLVPPPEPAPVAPELSNIITADANESAVEPAVSLPDTKDAKPKKKKPAEIFYRDQAKYVCTVCNERYFTKVEVTKCYEAHD